LLFQSREEEVDGFEPHGRWSEYLAFRRVCEDAVLDAIVSKVCIKVDLGFIDEFEIRLDYNSYSQQSVVALRWGRSPDEAG